ncbi:Transketolase, partial [Acropora cervicornis]
MPEPDNKTLQLLKDKANNLRILSIKSTNAAGSGHPTSCCSMAEIMSVLFFHTMRYKVEDPRDASSDRFVLSKVFINDFLFFPFQGHAAPILYAAWAEAGLFPVSELDNLRKIDSDLEGHPTPRLSFVDFATGSLGQESAEGSVWEAMNFASQYKLNNLCAIFDINRLGQSDPTMFEHDLEHYKKKTEAFGFHSVIIDGHNVEEVCMAFDKASEVKDKPTAILAKTFKGAGVKGVEDLENFHGKALGDKGVKAIEEIEKLLSSEKDVLKPKPAVEDAPKVVTPEPVALSEAPSYAVGQKVAVRKAYANGLIKLGQSFDRVFALDGDTKNSTYSLDYRKKFPGRHIECFVAEQNMIGVAMGLSARQRAITFSSTFAAFFTRTFDHLRMGVDGPSQMALEDIAMFRSIPNCVVFYPSDAVSCERAVELAANYKDMTFIRATRGETPVVYANDEKFEIGKAKSADDKVLVVGAGVTLIEALNAAEKLAKEGINIRVLDPFTVKPLDCEAIIENTKEVKGKVVTVEDHYIE